MPTTLQLRERLLVLVREDLVEQDNRRAGRDYAVYNQSFERSLGQRIGQLRRRFQECERNDLDAWARANLPRSQLDKWRNFLANIDAGQPAAGQDPPRRHPRSPEDRRARRLAQLCRCGIQLLRQHMVELHQGPGAEDRRPSAALLRSVSQRIAPYSRTAATLARPELNSFFLRYLGGRPRERWYRLIQRYDAREAARDNGIFENGAPSDSNGSSDSGSD